MSDWFSFYSSSLLRCHLSLCLTGFGFNGLWRFAGPFSKVWLTAPINAFRFPTERSEDIVCLRSLCSFLDLLTRLPQTSPAPIQCLCPLTLPQFCCGLKRCKWQGCMAHVSFAEGTVLMICFILPFQTSNSGFYLPCQCFPCNIYYIDFLNNNLIAFILLVFKTHFYVLYIYIYIYIYR